MLQITNLCKRYGDFCALDNLNLTIEDGELFGFVGPNGAGKTTTMKIMTGLLKADGGQVMIDGTNALLHQNQLKDYMGYMPDFFGVYDNLKAIEYMEFFAATNGIYGKEATRLGHELMELVNLGDKSDAYVDGLSRGMKQRLCLARCLIHNPKLLILDEPASGLDPRTRFEMKEILKNLRSMGKTIIISSHILTELAEMCSSIGIIESGKMVLQGSIDDILNKVNISNPLIITVYSEEEKAVKILRENPEIKALSIEDKKIMVSFSGNQQSEANLLKSLIEQGVLVTSYAREQGNLEAVFMQITGEGGHR